MSEPTSLLLGLEGVRVVGVVRLPDRTRVVEMVTADEGAAVKDRTVTRPRDVGYGPDPILLRWHKTRWRCQNQSCARVRFTEAIDQVPARRRTTSRLREQIGQAIGEAARSVVEVPAAHGVSWPTAHTAFCEVADRVLDDPHPVRVLGIDEARRGRPRWECEQSGRWYRVDPWGTGFVDLAAIRTCPSRSPDAPRPQSPTG